MYWDFTHGQRNARNALRAFWRLAPLLITLVLPLAAEAGGKAKKAFPRLGGYQIGSSPYFGYGDPEYQELLARLDYVILSRSSLATNDYARDLRARNPNMLLARYTNIIDVSPDRPNHQKARREKLFAEQGPNNANAHDWWARSYDGEITSNWPSMLMANITKYVKPDKDGNRWPEWAAEHYYDLWMHDPIWDAWFQDVVFRRPRTTESGAEVDWSGGKETSQSKINAAFREGHVSYWNRIKQLTPDKMIFVNHDWHNTTDSLPEYQQQVHGGLLEKVMKSIHDDPKGTRWRNTLEKYRRTYGFMKDPQVVMFVAQGERDNWQFFRYSFATALMNNGYFDYVPYEQWYGTVEWFDEFDLAGKSDTSWLGLALDAPPTAAWKNGVWRREFEGGMALVNPMGNGTITVNIGNGFRKIDGKQDRSVNNGKAVSSVTLKEGDGIVLVRSNGAVTASMPKTPTLTIN